MTAWLECSVEVDQEAVESVAEVLARYGYNGGVVVEPSWTPGDEGPEFRYDPSRPSVLRTYLPLDAQSEEARQRIEQALWYLGHMRPVGPLQVRTLAEEDWANAWKEHYTVMHIGARTVIVPSWLEYEARPDDVVLRLDPGMAFGTGLHPTTRLCLSLLEQYVQPGMRTLDLGTGSGILAIAAAKLGARPVFALDNDPVAVQVAAENVAHNGVHKVVEVAEGSLGAGRRMGHWLSGDFGEEVPPQPAVPGEAPHTFALIVANLIARVLITLADDLAANLEPGGILISSGIINTREAEVTSALAAAGLHLRERHVEGEWVALVHQG
ncbi:50S ribosomal protein L11 methyltransferase [Candidatus Chloroploca asiatica]|uniref:Ribosomal protein L11 methyltransferase n=1 Tax=Candidatus Chloroploca asiatica TaxID=1506545 RepID=A0A2H3L913_9CHLR|nr:50S ribosomal protein L11 methyltransferase [Candidatus Chloroploca asiatica]PDV98796.1 ribosomal protein L11 methyltransferase [Candidatus Chloroploca asiatica]